MATFEKENIFNLENSIEYTSGGVISKQITKSKGGNLTLFSFDKEQGLSEHKTSYDAIVQILDGEAEITINSKTHNFKKGDCIIMPANIPHSLNGIERFKMLLTMIKQEN
ncbi:MAG TPA: cupin domain-containing protein [Saprospiraceae bacterium]|nr:cupin domain-containing protein [Saprospiraceae bacterium]HRO08654.1 cupin domain-containing protein [Saprospiraceae bacterium]HRP42233.1 cupin domain-containing protein [Saprospiraceae bacterium]